MIYHVPSLFDHTKVKTAKFEGSLIEHIVERYPTGWPGGYGRVFINQRELIVDNYDTMVCDSDTVIIVTNELHEPTTAGILIAGATISWVTVASIVLTLLSAIMTAVFAKRKLGDKGRREKRVYSIAGAQNQPALGEVITEHFGKIWFYPDVASQPYTENISNDMYLSQILLLGAGEFDIHGLVFGNTQFELLPPGLVSYRVFAPQDHKKQYGVIQSEFNVYEDVVTSEDVQGLDFSRNGEDAWSGRSPEASGNGLTGSEIPSGFAIGDVVMFLGQTYWAMHRTTHTIANIQGVKMFFSAPLVADDHNYQVVKVVGGDDGWRGWFNTLPVGKTTNRLDFDFELPRGLNYIDNEGRVYNWNCTINIEIQGIDENDQNVGPLITKTFALRKGTRDPLRFTATYAIDPGRYKVRCRRDDADDVSGHTFSQVGWTGLKAFCVNTFGQYAYGNVTLIAIKMKASAALSSTADRISVLATRKLLTVASDFTTFAPTVNPVDSFAHVVRESDVNGVDVTSLKALGTKWAGTNGFNFRFDEQLTVYDALQLIASSHRATPEGYAKQLTMRQDVAKPFDQYIVTQENMVKESYSCGLRLGNEDGLIDGYRVSYRDPNGVRELYVVIPSGAISPEEFDFAGCTDKDTAIAMGNYLWAKRSTLRRAIEFSTEWDGNVYNVGDRISVLQNLVDTVRTARVVSAAGAVLTIDAITPTPIQVVVRLRNQYGEPSDLLNGILDLNVLTLSAPPAFPVFGADSSQDQTTVAMGTLTSFSNSYIISAIDPTSDTVQISGYSYSDAPYAYPIPGEV